MENRLFYTALTISFVMHASLIVFLSVQQVKLREAVKRHMEVTYQATVKQEAKENKTIYQEIKMIEVPNRTTDLPDVSQEKELLKPFMESIKDMSKFGERLMLDKRDTPRIDIADIDRKVTIPVLQSEKISNPQYLSYNETIRQKIRQRAYQYINHPDFKEGEVYLTFVLSADGTLKDLKLIAERTSANDYLKEVGLRSIKESSPFPPFPQNLAYPELTFNVVISFEVGK